ncbi:hypothetical protein ACVGVM_15820 [Pseudonocardia bannensis]|uniref:5,10-methylene-tetrahydrofolate dehydrogenase n=1 Tax=Pseudonocardia bannensis TaxID=630973 RepID=A0A848DEC9_9PSEU|nr:hypothetical protein [Pseudonocardia bannensis]NMH90980.1 hypothetical protein [Pseudonocardia bannensis]
MTGTAGSSRSILEGRGERSGRRSGGTRTLLIGLVADPGFATEIAHRLAEELPGALAERSGYRLHCRVTVVSETLSRGEGERIIDLAAQRRAREGWDFVVCLTDLPLSANQGYLVGDLSRRANAAVVSVPALDMLRPAEQARDIVVRLILEWAGELPADSGDQEIEGGGVGVRSGVQPVAPTDEDIDVEYAAPAGRLRLLVGMVRVNRPWRLVWGLRNAVAAGLASAAFGLVSSVVWQLSGAMSALRLGIATVASLAMIVLWLILNHNLWQHADRRDRVEYRQVRLYNAATMLTLVIGCGVAYVVLLAGSLATGWFVVVPQVLSAVIGHPAHVSDYLRLAWLVSSIGTIGGALGSGLESEDSVRTATYGSRERHRPPREPQHT